MAREEHWGRLQGAEPATDPRGVQLILLQITVPTQGLINRDPASGSARTARTGYDRGAPASAGKRVKIPILCAAAISVGHSINSTGVSFGVEK